MNIDDILKKIYDHEGIFIQNNYYGAIDKEDSYKYIKGQIPIILSAPHSVKNIREDRVKKADTYTGAIVLLLKELTECHVIYKAKTDDYDPNYHIIGEDGDYKDTVIKKVKEHRIELLIDFHGADSNRGFDIDIGTNYGNSLNGSLYLVNNMQRIGNSFGLTEISHNGVFSASKKGNITKNVAEIANIPAMQLEINKKHRNPYDESYNFKQLILTLIEFIKVHNNQF